MKLITLDFETYYSKDYSLRRMTPAEYILDDRYETICVATQVGSGPIEVVDGPEFGQWLTQHDPAECITLTYNALFDNCILAWRYGWVPFRMVDGLGMARACLGHKLRKLGLEYVAEHLGAGAKGDAIHSVLGMRRIDIKANGLWESFTQYAAQDVRLLKAIFLKLAPHFPVSEFQVLDLVLRCCVEPRFVLNVPKLTEHLARVKGEKEQLVTRAGVEKAQLMSTAAFAQCLQNLGVEVKTKISNTGNEIPALAKTDDFLNELLEHDDLQVQAVAAARLGVKSTLEEKRCERLLSIAQLPWSSRNYAASSMPIPLRYAGAHTQRLSGDWKINMQNLPSGRGTTSGALREALEAPAGHKVVVCDLGQIEARLTAWLARAPLLQMFIDGKDPYCAMATAIFGFHVTKDNVVERFVGKSAVLGLGFGLGPDNFYIKTAMAARAQGLEIGEVWTPALARKTVEIYRQTQAPIVKLWRTLDQILRSTWSGHGPPVKLGPAEIGRGYVKAPDGLCMLYDIDKASEFGEMGYHYGERPRKIYGAAFLENIIQFLARNIQMDAARRLVDPRIPFLRIAHTVHDELVFIVPDKYVDSAQRIIHKEMTRRPTWAPDLPLVADVGAGQSYGEAK